MKEMVRVNGTYHKGKLLLEKPIKTKKPIKVVVTFEDSDDKKRLTLSDFSFLQTQKLLEGYDGSFSDEVIEERRNEL
jgi:hypothetical protein